MSSRTRTVLVQLALTAVPAFAVMAVGCLGAGFGGGPAWLWAALGALIALPLVLAGAAVTALSGESALHHAAFAAAGAFLLRIGGAGVAAVILGSQPHGTAALLSMALCLGAALALEMRTWIRTVNRPAAPVAAALGESARA